MLATAGISGEPYEAAIADCVATSTGAAAVAQMRSSAYLFPDQQPIGMVPIKTVDEIHGHVIALAAVAVRDAPETDSMRQAREIPKTLVRHLAAIMSRGVLFYTFKTLF